MIQITEEELGLLDKALAGWISNLETYKRTAEEHNRHLDSGALARLENYQKIRARIAKIQRRLARKALKGR